MMKTIAVLLASLLAAPAGALELSLEENRAERGSVGYVDMQRLFAGSPDAARAKENFEELVRQAEEEVNARRANLVRLKQELAGYQSERDVIIRSTPTVVAPPPKPEPKKAEPKADPKKGAAKPGSGASDAGSAKKAEPTTLAGDPTAPAPAAPTPAAPTPAPSAPTASAPARRALSLPGFDMPSSTGAAVSVTAEPPLSINLPGVTTGQDLAAPAPEAAPAAAPAPEPVAEPAPAPQPEPSILPGVDPSAARLIELDGLIAARQAEIAPLEAALEREQTMAERNLLDAESRRTDQVLARLYRAVSEVARRDGVSVVVDKSAILYGHPAVDLTDRVLAHLRGPKQ